MSFTGIVNGIGIGEREILQTLAHSDPGRDGIGAAVVVVADVVVFAIAI